MTRFFMRLQQFLYLHTGGWIGHRMIGVPSLLLRTKGRRTGTERAATLVYARDGDAYVLVASNFGLDSPPGWFFNIEADPLVDVQVGRSRFTGRGRIVEKGDREYERLWRLVNENNHHRYDGYQRSTRRSIQLVVLEPAGN